ncbi:transposase [Nonomuraea sp. NPDC050202]|uniref:transposase n=1 Tax=Nonomuraea sp. NPDC050202 TaxID=3155035 RepID=UPI0034086C07
MANNEIARRLNLALNTVKKYARAPRVEQLIGTPKRGATLVDPFRDHLRSRWAAEPGVTAQTLLQEIKSMGYQGGSTLLYRYLGQGRAEDAQPPPSPRRVAIWIMTDPAHLSPGHTARLHKVLDCCLELKQATEHVRTFASLLTQRQGHRLDEWIAEVRATDLQPLRSFAEGLLIDHDAVAAGLTLPYSNGPTEGVVNKIKLLKRQMYGRAGLALLRNGYFSPSLGTERYHGNLGRAPEVTTSRTARPPGVRCRLPTEPPIFGSPLKLPGRTGRYVRVSARGRTSSPPGPRPGRCRPRSRRRS